ncbi:hypothetical protein TTHERM_000581748 (macronuclear) [Tetrahymena thermophila SB210]|uniref:Uncharacterized protein n=1 Tax=Tetrahymena thermophila (strain SB210) TaxID=312017 RepID=W7X8H6_TETTS|nr:hypothetical protein TTHERM_000581748 [Tetrahymena thermophila SB210]EWS73652.1 hypothetical protein TTHERM_000581748 [Tetrahymena thermophila SB210]|eukprot:XP_012653782.1 hypothetical protein TTHERM_000581748 [Tetrahymena thermophila SB210]
MINTFKSSILQEQIPKNKFRIKSHLILNIFLKACYLYNLRVKIVLLKKICCLDSEIYLSKVFQVFVNLTLKNEKLRILTINRRYFNINFCQIDILAQTLSQLFHIIGVLLVQVKIQTDFFKRFLLLYESKQQAIINIAIIYKKSNFFQSLNSIQIPINLFNMLDLIFTFLQLNIEIQYFQHFKALCKFYKILII